MSLDNILKDKQEIDIGGKVYRLVYSNWSLKNSVIDFNFEAYKEIVDNKNNTITDKMKSVVALGQDAMNVILAGIKTQILIENNDLQAIKSNQLSKASQKEIEEAELFLTLMDSMQLLQYFIIAIGALSFFMPKKGEGDGQTPPPSPGQKKGE